MTFIFLVIICKYFLKMAFLVRTYQMGASWRDGWVAQCAVSLEVVVRSCFLSQNFDHNNFFLFMRRCDFCLKCKSLKNTLLKRDFETIRGWIDAYKWIDCWRSNVVKVIPQTEYNIGFGQCFIWKINKNKDEIINA